MSTQTIADNKHYTLLVDVAKNRAYLTIKGYWRNVEAVPEYLNDWIAALKILKQGFSLLTDASGMKTHPQDVRKMHEQAQALTLKAGISRIAEVVKDDIAEIQLDALAETTKFPKKNFKTVSEAEKWLDESA